MRPKLAFGTFLALAACGPASSLAPAAAKAETCDAAALRAAADATGAAFSAWTPARGELPDYRLAVRGLRGACPSLPEGFHGDLEVAVHPTPEVRSSEMRLGPPLLDDPAASRPLLARCPDARLALAEIATLPADARTARLSQACKFADLGVFEAAELSPSLGDPGALHGHALYLWLIDDGAAPEVARALVRPIVAGTDFILAEAGRTRLPATSQGPAADGLTPLLTVSPEWATFDGRKLVRLEQGNLADSDHAQGLVGAAFDALSEEADRQRDHAERAGRPQSFALAIAADPTSTWATVGKLAWTAARAGATSVVVHALGPDPLRPIVGLPLLAAGPPPRFDLELGPEGVTLRCGEATSVVQTAGLAAAVRGCGAGSWRLQAAGDTPWQRVVEVLGALAGAALVAELGPPA